MVRCNADGPLRGCETGRRAHTMNVSTTGVMGTAFKARSFSALIAALQPFFVTQDRVVISGCVTVRPMSAAHISFGVWTYSSHRKKRYKNCTNPFC